MNMIKLVARGFFMSLWMFYLSYQVTHLHHKSPKAEAIAGIKAIQLVAKHSHHIEQLNNRDTL